MYTRIYIFTCVRTRHIHYRHVPSGIADTRALCVRCCVEGGSAAGTGPQQLQTTRSLATQRREPPRSQITGVPTAPRGLMVLVALGISFNCPLSFRPRMKIHEENRRSEEPDPLGNLAPVQPSCTFGAAVAVGNGHCLGGSHQLDLSRSYSFVRPKSARSVMLGVALSRSYSFVRPRYA